VKPSLLIASPQMRDPFFEGTVVLVWHHDEGGAIGVVVNKMLKQAIGDVLEAGPEVDAMHTQAPVGWGGPVEPTSGTIVSRVPVGETEGWNLDGGLSVSRSREALTRMLSAHDRFLLCLGYAGWGPGQLDDELSKGGWLWTDCDASLVFEVEAAERYDKALATLGLTRTTVWMQPIDE